MGASTRASDKEPLDWLIGNARHGASLPYLDGLRGVAVLLVFAGHFTLFDPTGFWLPAISRGAHFGVYLFFVLSAFLLTSILIRQLERRGLAAIPGYVTRRFLRIYPMFTVALVTTLAFPWLYWGMFGAAQVSFASQFFLIDAKAVFWAIAVEMEFYLILPFVVAAFAFSGPRRRKVIVALLAAFAIGECIGVETRPGGFQHAYPHVPQYLMIFAVGCALAMIVKLIEDGEFPRPSTRVANMILGAGGALVIWSLPLVARSTIADLTNPIYQAIQSAGVNAFLWGCVIFGLHYGSSLPRRIVSDPAIRWVGVISFSVYLTHVLVFQIFAHSMVPQYGFYAVGAYCLAITLFVSTATFIVIERPFLSLRASSGRMRTALEFIVWFVPRLFRHGSA